MWAVAVHASGKGRAALDASLEMSHPALDAEVMPANIVVNGHLIIATHLAHACDAPIEARRMIESLLESGPLEVELVLVVVLLSEDFMVPLEILEQDEAPALVEIDQFVHLVENEIQLCEQLDKRKYLVFLLLNK